MALLKYFADDPDFHGFLDHFFQQVAYRTRPSNLFLVRIDNWFDWKWLDFAGTVPIDLISLLDPVKPQNPTTALPSPKRGVWKSGANMRIPPFTPSRIIRQDHFLCAEGFIRRPSTPILVHQAERRRTSPKTAPRVLDICDAGWLFWLSSDSASTGRGSLLGYQAGREHVSGWYASFERTRSGRWIVGRSRNVLREALAFILDDYYAKRDV